MASGQGVGLHNLLYLRKGREKALGVHQGQMIPGTWDAETVGECSFYRLGRPSTAEGSGCWRI